MKKTKIAAIITAFVICLSGCGGNSRDSGTNNTTQKEQPKSTSSNITTYSADNEDAEEVFETTKDLSIDLAYKYDGDVYILVENTSDKPIRDIKLAWVSIDNNGFAGSKNGYKTGTSDAANLMPGAKKMMAWYDRDDGDNVVAVPTYIKYQNGDEWETNGLKSWADSVIASFNLSEHKSKLSELKNVAHLAESNDYVKIISTNKYHDNQFSSSDDFSFSVKNLTNKKIVRINLEICEFDKNGYAISVSPYDTYSMNCRGTGGTVNLAPNSSDEFVDNLFFEAQCSEYKVVVSYIVFGDETEWENPYLYEWIYANSNEYY